MRETAYAKLNLALHVRARERDGYHRIETLFAFCEDGDELSAEPLQQLGLRIEGPFAAGLDDGDDNLVVQAAAALRAACGVRAGAALLLDKRLPVASGIGGGSADAAAALRLLMRRWRVDLGQAELHGLAARLGADVPACLRSVAARGEGRGDRLTPVDVGLSGMPVLLVNPGVAVSTAAVFSRWDGVDRGRLDCGSLDAVLAGRNDLEASALALAPAIADVLAALRACPGVVAARMSGSGATCFALFGEAADRDAASSVIAEAQPGWWRLATRLR